MSKLKKLLSYGSALVSVALVNPRLALGVESDEANIIATGQFANLNRVRPSDFVRAIINILLGIAGVVAFIYLLWGGLQWILAGGDKEGTEKARKKITSALIGLAIVFSAYALLYIIRALFNIDVISVSLSPINSNL